MLSDAITWIDAQGLAKSAIPKDKSNWLVVDVWDTRAGFLYNLFLTPCNIETVTFTNRGTVAREHEKIMCHTLHFAFCLPHYVGYIR